jgi:von Willebrand factor type A domain
MQRVASHILWVALIGAGACNQSNLKGSTQTAKNPPPYGEDPEDEGDPSASESGHIGKPITVPFVDVSSLPKNEGKRIEGGPTPGGSSDSPPLQADFGLNCETAKTFRFAPTAPEKSRFGGVVTGEFCHTPANQLYVLFIVDNSASMGKHLASVNPSVIKDGNDPLVMDANNQPTCGRLRGAKAVIKKFQDPSLANFKTRMGVLSFASDVIETKEIKTEVAPLSENLVSEKIFCETINTLATPQPGGITVPGIDGRTNYQAALLRAKDMLQNITGPKLIFFITDGEPTVPSNTKEATSQAIAAAEKLRAEVKGLTINAISLKSDDSEMAKDTLSKITGDAKNVFLAANPDDIAKKIIEFNPEGFSTNTIKASLTIKPYPEEPLKAELTKHPTKSNVWIYKTQPFLLLSKPGETTDNVVQVTAQTLDGTDYKSTMTIQFTMQP